MESQTATIPTTADTVIRILRDKIGIPENEPITLETDMVKDLGVDSLDLAELVMHVEDKFELTIPTAEGAAMRTVADVVIYIDNAKGN